MDLCEDGGKLYVKIIDYKTGKTKFELTELFYGLQMQLVVYLDAAMEKEQRRHPDKQVLPAGIFYYNIADPMVEKMEEMSEEEKEAEILRTLRMNGLVNSRAEAISHLDGGLRQSRTSFLSLIRRESSRRQNHLWQMRSVFWR